MSVKWDWARKDNSTINHDAVPLVVMKVKCNTILDRMRAAGFDVINDASTWTKEECEYFIANYGPAYL